MGDFPESKGGRAAAVSPPFTSPANSSALEIGRERWVRAEKAAEKIICDVHPTSVSEQRRRDIIDYVQRLIGNSLGVEVKKPNYVGCFDINFHTFSFGKFTNSP